MTHMLNKTPRGLRNATITAGIAMLAAAPIAQAHHAMGGALPSTAAEGLLSGLAHPVIGLDHLAFLVVVTLASAMIGGRLRYLPPLAFVAATLVGTLIHLGSADLPMSEAVIASSALLGGIAVALRHRFGTLMLGGLFALFGVFHGYAYGESIVGAEQTPLLAYLVGFAVVQYALIAAGMQLTARLARRSAHIATWSARVAGSLAAVTGAAFLAAGLA